MNRTSSPVHTASGQDGRLIRRSALCRTCCGPSVFTGCSTSTYASTWMLFHSAPRFMRLVSRGRVSRISFCLLWLILVVYDQSECGLLIDYIVRHFGCSQNPLGGTMLCS